MKRSFLTVLAASSLLAFSACGGDADSEIEPVDPIDPAPMPAPAPAPMPMDTMPMDTMPMDTMPAPTTGQ
ncbi:MAG TPA: hypothetical protein VK928_10215 [Longimicrobiales bacterium]|nr:hypothetical protein [Longimicrobiales bacterium]